MISIVTDNPISMGDINVELGRIQATQIKTQQAQIQEQKIGY